MAAPKPAREQLAYGGRWEKMEFTMPDPVTGELVTTKKRVWVENLCAYAQGE